MNDQPTQPTPEIRAACVTLLAAARQVPKEAITAVEADIFWIEAWKAMQP